MLLESHGPGRPVRIVIADDHPIFRDGLKKLLETEPGFSVVGEASDGVDAIQIVQDLLPDVLLLDLAMPRLDGLQSLPALSGLPTKVILLTAAVSEASILRAIQLGARGVVLKEAATRRLVEGIHGVVKGKYVVGEGVVDGLAAALQVPAVDRRERRYDLTPREFDVIGSIVAGLSNKEIAEKLAISLQTVKHHLTNIFDKTGVSSRLELALFAVSQRLINDD